MTDFVQVLKDEAALPTTYERGLNLARAGCTHNVTSLMSEDPEDRDTDCHLVYGNVYGADLSKEVFVKLDLDLYSVDDYRCYCDFSKTHNGMCDHTIALALTYLSSINEPGIPYIPSSRFPPRRPFTPYQPPVKTSPRIERLVKNYADQALRSTQLLLSNAREDNSIPDIQASLTCIVSVDYASPYSNTSNAWSVALRLNYGKASYIVKNIDDLLSAWKSGAQASYGKRISFVHRRSAFTEQANELLEYVNDIAESQASLEANQLRRAYSSYRYDRPPKRLSKTLSLSSSQIIQLLDRLQGEEVLHDVYEDESYRSTRKKLPLVVCEGTPELSVRLSPGRDDSYNLSISPDDYECAFDGKTLYLLGHGKAMRCSEQFARDLGVFCGAVLPLDEVELTITAKDMPAFCAAVLPALQRHTALEMPEQVLELAPPAPEFTFTIGLEHGRLSCEALVSYGGTRVGLFEPAYLGQPVRSVEQELAAQELVRRYFPLGDSPTPSYGSPVQRPAVYSWSKPVQLEDPWFAESNDEAYYLLFAEGLSELSRVGTVLLSERLQGASVRQAPQVRVDARVSAGLLDLSVSSPEVDPAELAAYLASFHRKQRFVRLEGGDIVRLDGALASVAELAEGLGLDASELVDGVEGLSPSRTLFVDAMLKRAGGVRFERNRAFRSIVRDFETVADADFAPPEQLNEVLRPYQREGFKWLCTLGKVGFGGILADDMGLGKTVQAIAYLQHARDEGEEAPALVVCPASLVYNWRAEFEHFAPSMDVAVVTGDKRRRRAVIGAASDTDVLVTSYDLLRRDIDDYGEQRFSCVILDEAQFVKNHTTKISKAVRELKARVRLALTGTPIENHLLELWSIFDFLMPGALGGHADFSRRYATPVAAGDEGAARRLQALVSPFILRRLKRDVMQDLPDKNESVVVAELEGEQGKLYRASVDRLALMLSDQTPAEFAGQKLKILAELTKLRQICCDPRLLYDNYKGTSAKLDTCLELVRQAVEGGHALLLFSQFTSMLELIEERLAAEKIAWFKLTGATSKEERARLVERFQAGEVPVFLISLKAGGTGLNLTAADVVVHYDPWWNLAAQNQATDRTHRIGQDKEVSVFKLIAKDTIEERIVAMQEAKHDLAEQVIGGEAIGSSSITKDDLLALLGTAAGGEE